mmetsp:Transcript_33688/g.76688  ORF Transcript_33688/g.76688 Transcript_33688/m.76688 type:complete len:83 (-) Transcript_33688:11-259(-)
MHGPIENSIVARLSSSVVPWSVVPSKPPSTMAQRGSGMLRALEGERAGEAVLRALKGEQADAGTAELAVLFATPHLSASTEW